MNDLGKGSLLEGSLSRFPSCDKRTFLVSCPTWHLTIQGLNTMLCRNKFEMLLWLL